MSTVFQLDPGTELINAACVLALVEVNGQPTPSSERRQIDASNDVSDPQVDQAWRRRERAKIGDLIAAAEVEYLEPRQPAERREVDDG